MQSPCEMGKNAKDPSQNKPWSRLRNKTELKALGKAIESVTNENVLQIETGSSRSNSFLIPQPFSQRFTKTNKEKKDNEILETFCKVEVNFLPLDTIK